MKVRKKRKEAVREGDASAVMVSQGAFPAPALLKVPSGARSSFCEATGIYPCWHIFLKMREREGERPKRRFGVCSFLQREDTASASFTPPLGSLADPLPPPQHPSILFPSTNFSIHLSLMCSWGTYCTVAFVGTLWFLFLLPEPVAPLSRIEIHEGEIRAELSDWLTE